MCSLYLSYPHLDKLTGGKLLTHVRRTVFDTGQVWGHAVVQLVEVLCYKLEGHGFDSLWCQWNFSLT